MLHIRAISLDLDDTLWEVGPVIYRAESALWNWLGDNYPRVSKTWTQEALIEMRMRVTEEFPDKAHDFRFLRKTVLARAAAGAGYSDELVEPAFAVFDRERNIVDLFPEVERELAWLAENFIVVAATNGNADLHRIGIGRYFDYVVTSVAAGAAKPAAAVFDMVAELAGVSHDEILHVGDHPETDVAGARQAGMTTAWMNRGGHEWPERHFKPDTVIADFVELRVLLEPQAKSR